MIKIHLSDLLGKYRITQAELARKTGIRPATICDIYNEMCDRINLEHLDRICEVLGCDVADILEYQPNKIKKTGTNLILEQNGNRKNQLPAVVEGTHRPRTSLHRQNGNNPHGA